MDPAGEEELDYEDEDYGSKKHFPAGGGAISAIADEEMLAEEDEYDDLYNDVNVGEGFMQSVHNPQGVMGKNSNNGVGEEGTGPEHEFSQREGGAHKDEEEEEYGDEVDGIPNPNPTPVVGERSKGSGVAEVSNPGPGGYGGRNQGSNPGQADMKNGDSGARGGAKVDVGSKGGEVSRGGGRGGVNSNRGSGNESTGGSRQGESGGTMLFVGELHWWTTDAELEAELSKYGKTKELKFYEEKASGKSKGYCQVEFYDPSAAAACKEGMNGHVFNGRACVVAFASPHTVRQMGAAQVNKSQQHSQAQGQSQSQQRRMMSDGGARGGGGSYQSGDGGRNYGKMGWGRGGQGSGNNRGQGGGQGRGRGGMGGKGGGGGGGNGVGGPYGQGLAGPPMGGPPGGMMHPQGMMGQGFDPTYIGRGGGYGGFSSHGPAFPGMIPPFPPVGTVGLPGVAPHVNPAFFGRGVAANGMGMMAGGGMEGHQSGMWGDSGMGGWGGEDHNRRMRESSYGEDGGSDYGYGETVQERGARSSVSRDKERGLERDWAGNAERRRRDDREADWHRDRYREDKDGYMDQRQRERDWENEDDWEKEKLSRSRAKSRMMEDDDQRPRSKEADYGKRRRLPADLNE